MDKMILKVIWKGKRNRIVKTILKKIFLKEFEEHAQFDYKLNHKAKLTTLCYWHKDKHIKQWR